MREDLAPPFRVEAAIDKRLDLELRDVIVSVDAEGCLQRARCRRRVASLCDAAPAVGAAREMIGERHERVRRQLPAVETARCRRPSRGSVAQFTILEGATGADISSRPQGGSPAAFERPFSS